MNSTAVESPQSPCIDICVLDEADICMGCYRSVGEIAAWSELDAAGRCRVLERTRDRRIAAGALL